MSDYASELPVRSQLPGQVAPDDIIIKLGDASNPTTQLAKVDTFGSQYHVLADSAGNVIGDQNLASSYWLQVVGASNGPASPGTASAYSTLAGGIYNTVLPTLTNGQQASLQLDSSGRLLVDTSNTDDHNWGVVGANTLRTAAEIGNATGAADFNWGVVGAQTLRVAGEIGNATGAADFNAGATGAQTLRVSSNQGAPNTVANAWPIKITDGTNTVGVTAAGFLDTTFNSLGSESGGTAGTQSNLAGGVYNTVLPTLTNGQQAALQLDSSGRLLVDSSVVFPYDENWGVVGATTLRTAAEIGNATGAADFNYGTVGAQTLRVAAELGNATGSIDYNSGAPTAQTVRVAADLFDATGNPFSATNPLPVTMDTISGTAVDDYKDASSVAKAATDNHQYTVPAGKNFFFDQIICTASGLCKVVVSINGVAKFAQFNSTANPNINFTLEDAIEVATGLVVQVAMTNLDNQPQDLYSTICGHII